MSRIRVVLTGEGTYPYVTGGVSTWADLLVNELKNIDFILMPIQMNPYSSLKFEIPKNVIDVQTIPLWGTEEPVEYIKKVKFSKIYKSKLRTDIKSSTEKLKPIMISLLQHIFREKEDLDELGEYIYDFYEYFQEYDYYATFRKEELWDLYKEFYINHFKEHNKEIPSLFDMIEGLRYIFRFFITLLPTISKGDIYHSSAAAFCGLPCIIAKKKFGSKFLLTEHGIYIREQYLWSSRNKVSIKTKEFLLGLITTISKLNYHYADVISPVCDYNKRWELAWGANEDIIETIYNGIDINRYKNLHTKSKDRVVVMVARIDPLKDIETFIRTAKIVVDKMEDVIFKLYGPVLNEEYYFECKDLVKELGLEDNFIFAGKISSPQLAYNEADVVLLTSISEAFPFVVIEAMACERVVISSDVGGTKEVLEGYGFVVKPKDYASFAEKITYVLENPSIAKEMGFEARERVMLGFTTEDMIENYENLYKRLYKDARG